MMVLLSIMLFGIAALFISCLALLLIVMVFVVEYFLSDAEHGFWGLLLPALSLLLLLISPFLLIFTALLCITFAVRRMRHNRKRNELMDVENRYFGNMEGKR